MKSGALHGRRVIYTDARIVDERNVVDILRKALSVHLQNQAEIDYLYAYYRGEQPILHRVKDVRPEINNMIVENRANEIVAFKTGYLMGEPVQYVSKVDDDAVAAAVSKLNDYAVAEDKSTKDKDLAEWWHICGTSYRMVIPDAMANVEQDESPFEIFTLDPRYAFVVYSTALGTPPVLGVKYILMENGDLHFYCYTQNRFFEVDNNWNIVTDEYHFLGDIPVIEYPANNARLGAFETVITLLDAINTVESNRVDGIEQFVQALMLFHNVDISSEDYEKLRAEGAIKFKDIDPNYRADIAYLVAELNQDQTQTVVDSMYNVVLTICGMPNRNGGSSTSDTGSAVIMRDGWSAAEARAKDSEQTFKQSERRCLKIMLNICDALSALTLRLSAVDIRLTRRNYENITEKVNVLTTMLNNPSIAPVLAFTHCGLFPDPQVAYNMSVKYKEEQERKAQALAQQAGKVGDSGGNGTETDTDPGGGRGSE